MAENACLSWEMRAALRFIFAFDLVFVFELCVSLYNLQLSFILQLFFAPKTFVYMANSRSTRCHTHTWTNAYEGAQAASDCFSWLSRPPTDGLRNCSPYPLSPLLQYVQFVESFVASKFLLCFAVVFWPSTVEFTKFVTFVIFATSSTRVRIEVVVGVGVRVEGGGEKGKLC